MVIVHNQLLNPVTVELENYWTITYPFPNLMSTLLGGGGGGGRYRNKTIRLRIDRNNTILFIQLLLYKYSPLQIQQISRHNLHVSNLMQLACSFILIVIYSAYFFLCFDISNTP